MATRFSKKFSHNFWGNLLFFLFLTVIAAFMVIPLIFTISNAFKPLDELFLFPPTIFPKNPTFTNFRGLSLITTESVVPFTRYFFNSVFVTIVGTFGNIIISSLAAYRLAKFNFPLSKLLFNVVVFSLLFSSAVTGIPSYLIMSKLGLLDSHFSIILPAFSSSLGLFLMKQFMEQMIPDALIEAAQIDGASEWKIYWSIVMPIVKPAWFTLLIFAFKDLWNSTGGITIFREELKTLPYALQSISAGGIARTGVSAAVSLLMVIPPIVVFLISQSNVLQTMASSGIKE